jgi:hypothetical protein
MIRKSNRTATTAVLNGGMLLAADPGGNGHSRTAAVDFASHQSSAAILCFPT